MRTIFYWSIFLYLLFTLLSVGQTKEQKSFLKQFAKEQSIVYRAQRLHAESLATTSGIPIRYTDSSGVTMEIQRVEDSTAIYDITSNSDAAKTISTDKVWIAPYNLSGTGTTLGIWDGSKVLITHQEFGNPTRVTIKDGSTLSIIDHSTHVAGTMIAGGVQANAKGMSYTAKLFSYDWNNDASEMATAASNGLLVSNHSYGFIAGWQIVRINNQNVWGWFGGSNTQHDLFGRYMTEDKNYDNIARNAPNYLIVKSAGNDRGQGPASQPFSHYHIVGGSATGPFTDTHLVDGGVLGYDCVGGSGVAKNILTVGAVQDITTGYVNPAGVIMTTFSGWGPTDDGRVKPDIAANGYLLTSSLASSNTAYGAMSGTSMASPNASGSIGLLLQYQKALHGSTKLRSATLKALVIHTANEAGTNPGPDYSFGWGLMNTKNAASIMKSHAVDGAHIYEKTLAQGGTVTIPYIKWKPSSLRATLCWNDPAGTPVTTNLLNNTTPMLVNDLDLRVINSGSTKYPWVLNPASPTTAATRTTTDDTRNNVEQVDVAPGSGGWLLGFHSGYAQINHKGTLTGTTQDFSLILSGNITFMIAHIIDKPKFLACTLNGYTGLAVGANGATSRTVDGGATWDTVHNFQKNQLNAVALADTINGWAVGKKGTVLKTTNGGLSWTSVTFANSVELKTVTAISPTTAWVSGKLSTLYKTTDGGATWMSSNYGSKADIIAMKFVNNSTGWILGTKGLLMKTTDDGNTWVSQSTGSKIAFTSMCFTDSLNGWLAGTKGTILRTTDGGTNWLTLYTGVKNNLNGISIIIPDSGSASTAIGFAVGQDGIVLQTIDGGGSWYIQKSEVDSKGKVKLIKSATLNAIAIDPVTGTGITVGEKGARLFLHEATYDDVVVSLSLQEQQENSQHEGEINLPATAQLSYNYPNPFNPSTKIAFTLPVDAQVTLKVYDEIGREVITLIDNTQYVSGKHEITFNANNLATGIYFYRINAEMIDENGVTHTYSDVKRMLLMK